MAPGEKNRPNEGCIGGSSSLLKGNVTCNEGPSFQIVPKTDNHYRKKAKQKLLKGEKEKRTFAITADRRDNMRVRQIQTLHGHNMGFAVLCQGR
jgi:hypothetical protein